ncbi:MAG: alanine--tRNA ligase [Patescibacteria group bacterium]
MKSADVRRKFIEFYKARGHVEVPSAPLVPENDPTTLFISAGMQPLILNILGEPHPAGKRLVNSQKAVRMQDIDEVGDNRHTTFFEMLGNWSLGDYFKKEQLPWIFEFLTKELGLPQERLSVSVLKGDEESVTIWKQLGVPEDKIFSYGVDKNWWSRAGEPDKMPPGEPGGPDSEVFFDFGPGFGFHERSNDRARPCHPNCDCGRYMEIANSVFMQHRKRKDGSLDELPSKSVDFGGGLERLVAATEETPDVFRTDLFLPIIEKIEELSKKTYSDNTRAMRIVSDHVKAAVMMMVDGVVPGNKMQSYVLRRLIRRAMLYGRTIGIDQWGDLVKPVVTIYHDAFPHVAEKADTVRELFIQEAMRFGRTLERGLREIEKIPSIDGKTAFFLYESYGFPWEMTQEIAQGKGQHIDRVDFEAEFKKHQELSRTAAKGMFKGGLADQSEKTTKLHTATHLLHAALRKILGDHVQQKGSNITASRLRFDFSYPTKLTKEELEGVEGLVNDKIKENFAVTFAVMDKEEALKSGAMAFFGERYADKVKVYSVGSFSKEICGGPHVSFTGTLGRFTIMKEESAGAGVRRIYATLH